MTLGVILGAVSLFPFCVFPASPVSSIICKVGTWLSTLAVLMGDIAGGRGRPLFVNFLSRPQVSSAPSFLPSYHPLQAVPQLGRCGYSPGESKCVGVEGLCLQDTGDSPEVVSVAGEVQAAPSWRDSREILLGERHWKGLGKLSLERPWQAV